MSFLSTKIIPAILFGKGINKRIPRGILVLCLLGNWLPSNGQDLEPRAYIRVPVNAHIIIPAFNYSHGKVLTDPTVPLKDFKANVGTFALRYAQTFSLFGLTAQA